MSYRTHKSPALFETGPFRPDDRFEMEMAAADCQRVAGIDEAGRGPLAGPVVAAAVILDPTRPIEGLADSKTLTAKARERLFGTIMDRARGVATASACARTIDDTDILKASLAAMVRALSALCPAADGALIDGNRLPGNLPGGLPARAIVKGDARCLSIAAASIVAKVTRDRMMAQLDIVHPGYGFARHKGYGSAAHRDAIADHGGVRRIHRFSFRPLRP